MVQTLEDLLKVTDDELLVAMYKELSQNIAPALGVTERFRNDINMYIDKGALCINPTTYRKIYLPTLARALYQELARRYVSDRA